jgi:hypothetical protein
MEVELLMNYGDRKVSNAVQGFYSMLYPYMENAVVDWEIIREHLTNNILSNFGDRWEEYISSLAIEYNPIHNYDMEVFDGKIFAGLGTEAVEDTVAVSQDGGKTFTFAPLYKDGAPYDLSGYTHSRTYEFVTLNDNVYALIALYKASGSATWGIFRYEGGKMHYMAAGQTLLEGSEISRKYFGGDFELNGTCYLTARRLYAIQDFSDPSSWQSISMPNKGKVSDAILRDGVIYVLSSRQNADKTYHTIIYRSTTGLPDSFEEFAVYDYGGFPLSFDFDGTHFYVGTSTNTFDKNKVGMVLRIKPTK